MVESVTVNTTGVTRVSKIVAGNNTIVKKIVVGRPVRRVTGGAFSIEGLADTDTSGLVDGSVLVYNATTGKWVATLNLEQQNINGGSY